MKAPQTISFTKTRRVKSPNRANQHDAGMDFFIPEDTDWDSYTIWPNTDLLLDTGIKMNVPEGTVLICLEKSSVAKSGLIIGAKVVDAGYQGNIHIHLVNTSKKNVTINRGQKIAQFVLLPVLTPVPVEVADTGDLFKSVSSRGEGGFGSTGNGLDNKSCLNNCTYPNCKCDEGPNPV